MNSEARDSLNSYLKRNATPFRHDLIIAFPQFDYVDLEYVIDSVIDKVSAVGVPVSDCIINNTFVDANFADYHRKEYCLINCGFRCKTGRDYRKIDGG